MRLKAKCQNFTIIQCYAPTNDDDEEENENFYEKSQHTLNNTPKRDIKIVMGDLNAKIGEDNENREKIMGKYNIGERNENGLKLVEFCEANELVIGGSLFPQKDIHNGESPDEKTKNQIDHIMINQRWRSSLQDVTLMRGADCNSDYRMLLAKMKIKLSKEKKTETKRVKYNIDKLKDLQNKDEFQLELRNEFSALHNEEQELDIDREWTAGRDIIKNACEERPWKENQQEERLDV